MAVTLPTNFDWSSVAAPSGPFGVEPIAGSESVLQNLSGAGALGTNGILGFLSGLGSKAGNLQNLTRFAGSLGSLLGPGFDIAASTKALEDMAKKTEQSIDQRISNIYPALTGLTGEQALNRYRQEFADTVQKVQAQGRADLGIDPEISKQYGTLSNRIEGIQAGNLNLSNLVGGYEKLALDPPVVSMNTAAIRSAADWVDPTTNQVRSEYKALYDYSDPQSKQFIYGSPRTADAIGKYYNTSGDVAGLMNYGTLA